MATIVVSLLMVVCGALLYALAANPKLAEIGRLMCAAGLFAIAFAMTGRAIRLF